MTRGANPDISLVVNFSCRIMVRDLVHENIPLESAPEVPGSVPGTVPCTISRSADNCLTIFRMFKIPVMNICVDAILKQIINSPNLFKV